MSPKDEQRSDAETRRLADAVLKKMLSKPPDSRQTKPRKKKGRK